MELKDAYMQLKEAYEEFHRATYSELRAKPRVKSQFHREANDVKDKVWRIFESCPVLYEYVPYKGEFFTSFFDRDFKTLMNTLDEMKIV